MNSCNEEICSGIVLICSYLISTLDNSVTLLAVSVFGAGHLRKEKNKKTMWSSGCRISAFFSQVYLPVSLLMITWDSHTAVVLFYWILTNHFPKTGVSSIFLTVHLRQTVLSDLIKNIVTTDVEMFKRRNVAVLFVMLRDGKRECLVLNRRLVIFIITSEAENMLYPYPKGVQPF